MALKQANNTCDYVKWGEVAEGAVIKGFLIESKPSANYPDQTNHYIETLDGSRYGLNGNGLLDLLFQQMRPNWYFELTYKGMEPLAKGPMAGKMAHCFDLAYDDEKLRPTMTAAVAPGAEQPAPVQQAAPQPVQTLAQPVAAAPQPAVAQPTPVAAAPAAAAPKRSIF